MQRQRFAPLILAVLAAPGGSREGAATRPAYRVAVRMPDGTRQYRDLDRPEFRVGDHVLLTNAGDVVPD